MKRDLTTLKAIIKADYQRHVRRFSALESPKDIIFVGDSLVAYFPLKTYDLEDKIVNFGIPGDTTNGVMDRLDQVMRLKPKQVLLHVGLNDEVLLTHTAQKTAQHMSEIVSTLKRNLGHVSINLISLTPINQTYFPHGTYVIDRDPQFSIDVNQLLKKIEGINYIDLYHPLLDDHHELDPQFTTDGIHLNDKGYAIYLDILHDIL